MISEENVLCPIEKLLISSIHCFLGQLNYFNIFNRTAGMGKQQ